MDPVACGSCGARFPVSGLTENDHGALHDQYYYHVYAEELRVLHKVQGYFRRHPEARKRIHSRFGLEDFCADASFDQPDPSSEGLPVVAADVDEELEVEEFLWCNYALGPQMRFVSEQVARLKDSVGTVPCPRCNVGRLQVPPEDWDQFAESNAITWNWPEWHSIDSDGTLHVKASGYSGDSHWTGKTTIAPEQPEYEFWRWLVAQKKHHRLVEESELRAIQEEWSR
jgi:hypothetical protein